MLELKVIWTFLTSPIGKALGVLVLVAGLLFYVYHQGEEATQVKWDAEKVETQKKILALEAKAGQVTTVVETKYVDRVKTVEVKGATIIEYVDRWITPAENAKCIIPNNFVLLHDSAVKNVVPTMPASVASAPKGVPSK